MPDTFLTDDDLRAKLREAIGALGQRAFARQHDLDHTALSRILAGKRSVGQVVAGILGYTMAHGHVYIGADLYTPLNTASTLRHGYKILTHEYRSPIKGGAPIWDGVTIPYILPSVALDTSQEECASGWNYCGTIAEALPIAGLWPTGRPSVVCVVEASADAVQRGTKRRASGLTILRRATAEEFHAGLTTFSVVFAPHTAIMVQEQEAWRTALGRPRHDAHAVEAALADALQVRGLTWEIKRFPSASAAFAAWGARSAWADRDARAAWDARPAWTALSARAERSTWNAIAAWDDRAARPDRGAQAAQDALMWLFAAQKQRVDGPSDIYTRGIREAYANGLGMAVPLGNGVLGWAMEEELQC